MKISSSFPVGAHTFLFVSRSRRIKSFLLSLIILKNTLCNSSYRKNYCIFTLMEYRLPLLQVCTDFYALKLSSCTIYTIILKIRWMLSLHFPRGAFFGFNIPFIKLSSLLLWPNPKCELSSDNDPQLLISFSLSYLPQISFFISHAWVSWICLLMV